MRIRETVHRPPSETSSGDLHSGLAQHGSKRPEVRRLQDIMRERGLTPERILIMSKKERARVIQDLADIANRPEIDPKDAEAYFRNQAEVSNTLADAFKEAGLAGENAQDTATRLQKEIPNNKAN